MAKAKAKHHEKQRIARVELVRARVIGMVVRDLASLRSFVSTIDGNEHIVEMLRGVSGEEIVARVSDFVMQELGDTSNARDGYGESGASRAISRKVRGTMGPASEEVDVDAEPQTA